MSGWGRAPGRDDELAELRRIEIGTALLLGIVVFAVPTVGFFLLTEVTGLVGPRWDRAGEVLVRAMGALGFLTTVAWLARVRRHEPLRQ